MDLGLWPGRIAIAHAGRQVEFERLRALTGGFGGVYGDLQLVPAGLAARPRRGYFLLR